MAEAEQGVSNDAQKLIEKIYKQKERAGKIAKMAEDLAAGSKDPQTAEKARSIAGEARVMEHELRPSKKSYD